MILVGLFVVVVVAQVASIGALASDDTADNFAAAITWYGTSALNVVVLTGSLFKICEWQYITNLRPSLLKDYRRWGMERELANHTRSWLYGPMLVAAALWSPISLIITISVVAPVIAGRTPFLDTTGRLVIYWIVVALSVIAWALQDHSAFDKKRAEISGLRSTFR